MGSKTILLTIVIVVVIVSLFFFVPLPQEPSPSLGAPAEFGDTTVEEMVVIEQEPLSMFCRIYPSSCD